MGDSSHFCGLPMIYLVLSTALRFVKRRVGGFWRLVSVVRLAFAGVCKTNAKGDYARREKAESRRRCVARRETFRLLHVPKEPSLEA